MDVFEVHRRVVDEYRAFTSGYVQIYDERLRDHTESELDAGLQWPEPWLSLNPAFASGGTVDDLVEQRRLHPDCAQIFRTGKTPDGAPGSPLTFHQHQADAVDLARSARSYVLTTGTGSGKSLAYVVPIVDAVLRMREETGGRTPGVKAIIVYPMNALANSQMEEMAKFLSYGYPEGESPVTFDRYTGQESEQKRQEILAAQPDILLTNYVMLDLVLTRPRERQALVTAAAGLRFLVLDELHTYRGRQGADVAYLVRRVREACQAPDLQCVGTSATMSTEADPAARAATVAEVASRIFGTTVSSAQVVGETLVRATNGGAQSADGERAALQRAVRARGDKEAVDEALDTGGYDVIAADPLASWIERTFGINELPDGQLARQEPTRVQDAAQSLAEQTELPVEHCERAIRYTLVRGSAQRHPVTGRPLFAFRLHQFLSKGDTPHVTLEDPADRYLTSTSQLTHPEDSTRPLYPLSFCRQCGQDYLQVDRVDVADGVRFLPRGRVRRDLDPRHFGGGRQSVPGYLFVAQDIAWPADPIAESRYPDAWVEDDGTGERLVSRYRDLAPVRVQVAPDGGRVPDGGLQAAFVPAPFRFCLRCRTAYEQARGSEYARLATLDREGRSSAVTVLSSATVRALRAWDSLPDRARKLLTFVDNRQDASLQAGHFNDFAQVVQLRGALHRALREERHRMPEGVLLSDVAPLVVRALGLSPADYMTQPDSLALTAMAERALRAVIELRVVMDLERGWKITLPNLEQSGLLRVGYLNLTAVAANADVWAGCHGALAGTDPAVREEIVRVLLDEFRRVLAVESEPLTGDGFEALSRRSRDYLKEPWSVADTEPPPRVGAVVVDNPAAGRLARVMNLGARGAFGRWLLRPERFQGWPATLTSADATVLIADLVKVLERQGYLVPAQVFVGHARVTALRIASGTLVLHGIDSGVGAPDPLRVVHSGEAGARVVPFFRALYRDASATMTGLHAAEHTAQVPAHVRQEREVAFRQATDLNLLYCSPTMELGVDIADLNAVMMRNVPPTPANYVQRSGRAGRSGQQALVTTYCATGNAHDQFYFRRSKDMVAGSVNPPRIDLANIDLVRSHVQAIWLAETGADLGSSMADILDVPDPDAVVAGADLPVQAALWARLTSAGVAARATDAVHRVLRQAAGELAETDWYSDAWVEQVVGSAPAAFDAACERWRSLYKEALSERARAHAMVLDRSGRHGEKEDPRRRRAEAEQSIALLLNRTDDRNQSDFYSYRYLAGEGFLPGYSFPRLPLAAFIPGRTGRDGDYVQRPRFLAISEFGPGALIYHEGARYQVTRVQLPRDGAGSPGSRGEALAGGVDLGSSRVCTACSCHHPERPGLDVCEVCGTELPLASRDLMRMQAVKTRRRERISADEEERNRVGFELRTTYRFASEAGVLRRTQATWVDGTGELVCEADFGDSAEVRVTNLGRRVRKNPDVHGFMLDTVAGRWLRESDDDSAAGSDEDDLEAKVDDVKIKTRVVPYVDDTRNILLLRWSVQVDPTVRTSLQYAIERAIEVRYQLEDSELRSEPLDDPQEHGRTLFFESAEGGAGVLRRLVAEPDALAEVAAQALRLMHYDPDTMTDLGRAAEAREACGKACYDCLLSYGNQSVHDYLDRHAVVPVLQRLLGLTRTSVSGGRTTPAPVQPAGDDRTPPAPGGTAPQDDDSAVARFIAALVERGVRPPDQWGGEVSGVPVDACWRLPTFVVGLVSGPDAAARADRLIDHGVYAIQAAPDTPVDELVNTHASVLLGETPE